MKSTDQWAVSKQGRLKIRCHLAHFGWEVYALYNGTHELAPRTRRFGDNEQAARNYANYLWRNS